MKSSLSGPSSGPAGPSLIGDSDSEQTWHMSHVPVQRDAWRPNKVKGSLSGPSSGLAGPSLIRDSGPSCQISPQGCSVQHLMNDQQSP